MMTHVVEVILDMIDRPLREDFFCKYHSSSISQMLIW
jgi:hypothetical protein